MDAIDTQILEYLEGGERLAKEIYDNLCEPRDVLEKRVQALKRNGSIFAVRRGVYALPSRSRGAENKFSSEAVDNVRTKADNSATINTLLNLFDEVLLGYSVLMREILRSGADLEQKERFLTDFKNLTLIGDKLLKRWNLETVGYDNNSKQAQEDAKEKTAAREKEALDALPPEAHLKVVREYGDGMREILENMPGKAKADRTV